MTTPSKPFTNGENPTNPPDHYRPPAPTNTSPTNNPNTPNSNEVIKNGK